MATNFPTSLDSYTTKVDGTDYPQAAHVNDPQSAIVALETKVGINSSAVTTTHDYKIAQLESGRALVGGSNATGTWPVSVSGNAATATAAAASGLTGATLAAVVTASSLTSFGASPALGTPASGNLANCTFPTLNQNTSGNAATATNVVSGTYTPTLTNVANVSASTAYVCQFMRVQSVVTVSGRIDIDIVAAATLTTFDLSFPIASAITLIGQVGGCAMNDGVLGSSRHAAIFGNTAAARARLSWVSDSTAYETFFFSFTYLLV